MKKKGYWFVALSILFLFSCKRKEDKITHDPSADLSFSQTQILFDTLFTSVGSVTKRLWVYNENKNAVVISSIQLARQYFSSYKMTINGEEMLGTTEFELKGKDSMLILVKVLINPQNKSLPYLVDDSIVFVTNGNLQDVDLLAYGQDANFITNTTVACNTTWTNVKPYVITGKVTVPPGCTLTIDQGTRLRFHKDATLQVKGTLLVLGQKDSIVTFRHDNLSNYFAETAGQWGGLVFGSGSKNNLFQFAEIKNATNAITMKDEADGDTIAEVRMENCSIVNCAGDAFSCGNTDLYLINCLVNNTTNYLLHTKSGGNFYLDYCTLANYSYDFFRETPAVLLSNHSGTQSGPLVTRFRNTIVWGDKTEEISSLDNGTSGFTCTMENVILKSSTTFSGLAILANQDPLFVNYALKKFTLQSTSPAINSGKILPSISDDLLGATRDATPDRGCYEF